MLHWHKTGAVLWESSVLLMSTVLVALVRASQCVLQKVMRCNKEIGLVETVKKVST